MEKTLGITKSGVLVICRSGALKNVLRSLEQANRKTVRLDGNTTKREKQSLFTGIADHSLVVEVTI